MNADRSPDRGQDGPGRATGSRQTMHLVCDDCGAVEDGEGPISELIGHLEGSYGFEPRSAELTVFGLCRHCRPS
ncbi:MAG: hypothetical protein OEV40_22305 [Acidimicrobiia bacterium]|nr:hypothetical protein [Acidimicrobiia bacterium]